MAIVRVGSVAGVVGEKFAQDVVVDHTRSYIYVLTSAAGNDYVVRYNRTTFLRVDAITLSVGDGGWGGLSDQLLLDEARGFLYVYASSAGGTINQTVMKINLTSFTEVDSFTHSWFSMSRQCTINLVDNCIYLAGGAGTVCNLWKVDLATMAIVDTKYLGESLTAATLVYNAIEGTLLVYTGAFHDVGTHPASSFWYRWFRLDTDFNIITQGTGTGWQPSYITYDSQYYYMIHGSSLYPASQLYLDRGRIIRRYSLGMSGYTDKTFSKNISQIILREDEGTFYVVEETTGTATDATIHKVEKATLVTKESLALPTGDIGSNALAIDVTNELFYFADNSDPFDLIKISSVLDTLLPLEIERECLLTPGDAILTLPDAEFGGKDSKIVEKSDDGETGWTTAATITDGSNTLDITDLEDETAIYYRHRNVYKTVESPDSKVSPIVCDWHPLLPCPPYSLTYACQAPGSVQIAWSYEANDICGVVDPIDGFKLERMRDDEIVWTEIATPLSTARSHVDTIDPSHLYEYRMRAYYGTKHSPYSFVLAVDCQSLLLLEAPILAVFNPSRYDIKLVWADSFGDDPGLTYKIWRRNASVGGSWKLIGTTPQITKWFLDTEPAETYRLYSYEYKVQGHNYYGGGAFSNIEGIDTNTIVIVGNYSGIHTYIPANAIPVKYDGLINYGQNVFQIKETTSDTDIENLIYYGTPLP